MVISIDRLLHEWLIDNHAINFYVIIVFINFLFIIVDIRCDGDASGGRGCLLIPSVIMKPKSC
jgi:hypothetical protein